MTSGTDDLRLPAAARAPVVAPPAGVNVEPSEWARVGTLVYTRRGLVTLFFWVLAGDFLFSLMDTVEPRVLPLILERHGASNKEISVIVTSLAAGVNCLVNPVVSYCSDRTQSRWGRRIPYLALATPFVAIFLALIPFAPEVTGWLQHFAASRAVFALLPVSPLIAVFAVLVVIYQVFNMVVGSVYYYLLRDVVPLEHLGRMTSLFRMFAFAATFVFNYWLFGYSEQHAHAIFGGIALCYGVGYLLMCWKVREGCYPPVHDTISTGRGAKRIVANYVCESYGPPIYRWVYATRVFALSSGAAGIFSVFFVRDQLGLDLDTIGKLSAWPLLLCMPLAYPCGIMLDRWGAIRGLGVTIALMVVTNVLAFAFVRDVPSLFVFSTAVTAATLLFSIAQSVFLQTMFHPDRVGQLSSANALLAALAGVALGPLCGWFFDWTKDYRYVYLWPVGFSLAAAFCLWQVARYWHAAGGPGAYRPPL